MKLKRDQYQGVSIGKKVLDKVKEHIKDDWRYNSNTAFIRTAIIEKIERES